MRTKKRLLSLLLCGALLFSGLPTTAFAENGNGSGANSLGGVNVNKMPAPKEPEKCVCETLCDEDNINPDCLVCAEDFSECEGEQLSIMPMANAEPTLTVNVSPADSGTVTVKVNNNTVEGTEGSYTVEAGQLVTLEAQPDTDSGYVFQKWEVTSGGVTVAADNTFTMPEESVEIAAVFAKSAQGGLIGSDSTLESLKQVFGENITFEQDGDSRTIKLTGNVVLSQTATFTSGNWTLDLDRYTISAAEDQTPISIYGDNVTITGQQNSRITGGNANSDISCYGMSVDGGSVEISGSVSIIGGDSSGDFSWGSDGLSVSGGSVEISGSVSIIGGDSSGDSSTGGAGLYVSGSNVTISDSVSITGGSAFGWGGDGLAVASGSVEISDSVQLTGGDGSVRGGYGLTMAPTFSSVTFTDVDKITISAGAVGGSIRDVAIIFNNILRIPEEVTINGGIDGGSNGILFRGNNGTVYGSYELSGDLTLSENETLTVPAGTSLTIPEGKTLGGSGIVINNGGSITGTNNANTINVTAGDGGSATGQPSGTSRQISLTATADSGRSFDHWKIEPADYSNNLTGATNPNAVFTMPAANVTATAVFKDEESTPQPTQHSITVKTEGSGTAGADQTKAAQGTEVTLTQTADDGWHFKEWKASPETVEVINDKFTMPGNDVEITAVFVKDSTGGDSGSDSGSGGNTGETDKPNNPGDSGSGGGANPGDETASAGEAGADQQAKKLTAPKKVTVSPSYNKVKISWKKVKGATGYQVYRSAKKNGKYKKVKTTKARTWTNRKLKTGKTWYYKVRAYKKETGKTRYSKFSARKRAKVRPAAPALKVRASKGAITAKWSSVAGATRYQLYRASKKNGKYYRWRETVKRGYVDRKKLHKGKTCYYKVRAYRVVKGKKIYGKFSEVKNVRVK